jgi:hypothetical protein
VVALGCLDEGGERGEGQGRYLSWLGLRLGTDPATRIGWRGWNTDLTVCSQLRALHRTGLQGERLLAWIVDQVRLKALVPNKRALYTGGGAALCYIGNNSEPIRGELKHKGTIRSQGTIEG